MNTAVIADITAPVFIRIGIKYFLIIAFRAVGERRAKELILLGTRISASLALSYGLVNRVSAAGVNVVDDTLAWLEPILSGAPLAAQAALKAINAAAGSSLVEGLKSEADAYELCLKSEDRREALRAFAEKRAPRFRGN